EYEAFIDALAAAEKIQHKSWEQIPVSATDSGAPRLDSETWVSTETSAVSTPTKPPQYFEGCLPIEEIARRGRDTLRFGPMKPAGLTDPKTGRWPYAWVQLRQENIH